jgi:uncharacterized DUF497 family protein
MKITVDALKDTVNIDKHVITLADAKQSEWNTPDTLNDYGDNR